MKKETNKEEDNEGQPQKEYLREKDAPLIFQFS